LKKFIFWLPRVLAILIIAFITLFSLDVFSPGGNIWLEILGFLIHSIPSLLLIIILIVAWKWPKIGGIILLTFAALFTGFYLYSFRSADSIWAWANLLILAGPIFLAGILFLVDNKVNMEGK